MTTLTRGSGSSTPIWGALRRRQVAVITAIAAATGYRIQPTLTEVVLGLALLAAGLAALWRHHPATRLRRELGERGWLGYRQLRAHAGAAALRANATATRPDHTLGRRAPLAEYGARVGRLVSGPWWMRGRAVYSPWTRGVLVLGPQGSGKTSWLVGPILDAPGAAYVTSTKTELVTMTGRLRAQIGPVHVFNPTSLGGLLSTLGWDPVRDCTNPDVADARARALVRGGGGVSGAENADFWANKAVEIVRAYLLAAALTGQGMAQVMDWAVNHHDQTPMTILEQHSPDVPAGWLGTLVSNLDAAPATLSGYLAGVIPAVSFMDNPLVAAACRPDPDNQFDIEAFLRDRGTLYVVAGEDDRRIAPLLTALTEAVFATAKRVAATCPGGRLDPPLSMFLDEVANTTPVPLDQWAADSRGWGITVFALAQDLAQLQTRWGRSRAQTIFSNLPTKVVLPGVSVKDDLESLAYLGGQRTVRQTSEHHGHDQTRPPSRTISHGREPVITGHLIYGLPRWHAYILGLGTRAAVIRFQPGHRRARTELRRLERRLRNQPPSAADPTGPALVSIPPPDQEREAA